VLVQVVVVVGAPGKIMPAGRPATAGAAAI